MAFAGDSAGPVLECQSVERHFGGIVALNGIDMRIERGEIFGLVGPNGCGKTTLTNAITGFYPPQRGSIAAERPRHHRAEAAPYRDGSAWRAPSRTWRCSTA